MLDFLFALFITEKTRTDVNTFAKAKNIVLLATSLASLNAFFAVYSLVMSLPLMMFITCTTAVIAYMIPLLVLRRTQSPTIAGTIITGEAYSVVVALCFITGETIVQSMPWFIIVPLIAAMTSGRRFSVIGGVVSMLTMIGLAEINHVFASANGISGFIATFFLMLFTTICLAALETAKSTMLKHIEAERTRVAEEAAKSEALAEALAAEKNHIEEKITHAIAASEQQKARLADGVHTMLTAMDALAEGDLTMKIAIDGNDEVSQLYQGFNHVAMTFHNMVAEVQDAIHVTANTTSEVNYAAAQIAAAVEEQSSQMTHIAAAVEQMFQSVRQNMECANDTSLASKENVHNAQSGGALMEQMMTKMEQIVSIAQNSEHLVEDLNSRSAEIGEIVSVIHEIADQTNLLALNAAIEAARAGDHGRGFSVVADEVRKLAERTVSATKQISQTVKGIQTQTGTVMQGIRTSNHEVSSGITIAVDASSSFAMIVAGDEVIRMKVEEIASATEQQASSNQQINSSIQQIAAATEETSVIVHEVSTSTDNLSKRMERLLQLSSVFKTHHQGDIPKNLVEEVSSTAAHRRILKGSSLAQFALEAKARSEYQEGARKQALRQPVRSTTVAMQ